MSQYNTRFPIRRFRLGSTAKLARRGPSPFLPRSSSQTFYNGQDSAELPRGSGCLISEKWPSNGILNSR
ncbi:hypothetical protein CC2G_002601 [Coprinopsis cinerea AmutBmut pab1-1]|nr:hypothetical protein CC2G_002601 [Coprinopsis cinerea AmutBmut pab1-1]